MLEVAKLYEVIIVGAGPCGIAAAIECKKHNIKTVVLEKGCLVNSIYHYPLSMTFFSSADNLEIGGIPFTTPHEKPKRHEALAYYRTVVKHYELNIHTYEKVIKIEKQKTGFFRVWSESRTGTNQYESQYVILATGYYDNPNMLEIPGETMDHVHHYFRDAHPYSGQKVVVIGGRNSAIDAALELHHVGADVTMIYRKNEFHPSVKAWVKPVIESAIENKRIRMFWGSNVKEIRHRSVVITQEGVEMEIPAEHVFAMTGYHPELTWVNQLGGAIDEESGVPVLTKNMETTVPGLYLAGVAATGHDSTKIFIENGRYHGHAILEDILSKKRL